MSWYVCFCDNCKTLRFDPEQLTPEEEKEYRLPPLPEHKLDGDFYSYCYVCHDWKPHHTVPDLSDR